MSGIRFQDVHNDRNITTHNSSATIKSIKKKKRDNRRNQRKGIILYLHSSFTTQPSDNITNRVKARTH